MTPFFRLLHIYLGLADSLDAPLTKEQWESVFLVAKQQAVLGVVFAAIMRLPEEQMPPRQIKVRFALAAEKIAAMNAEMTRRCAQITSEMKSLGLECCVLKGQGTAMLYPEPSVRQCGDIDLWVKGDYRDTLCALRSKWKVGEVYYHHADIHPFGDKMEAEIHFHPSWMNSPITNRILQKWFLDSRKEQMDNFLPDKGFCKTTLAFDCVFAAVHIYRHLLLEGIGLRQVMDYYYILKESGVEDRRKACAALDSFGMRRFVSALMYVLQDFFRLEDQYLVCSPDDRYGKFLREEILRSGNFGRFDERYSRYSNRENILVKFLKRAQRLPHYISIAPSEVLWAPVFKTWQHLWQAVNHF